MTTDTAELSANTPVEAPARVPWRRPRRANGKRYAHRGAGWRLGAQQCCSYPARLGHADTCPRVTQP